MNNNSHRYTHTCMRAHIHIHKLFKAHLLTLLLFLYLLPDEIGRILMPQDQYSILTDWNSQSIFILLKRKQMT